MLAHLQGIVENSRLLDVDKKKFIQFISGLSDDQQKEVVDFFIQYPDSIPLVYSNVQKKIVSLKDPAAWPDILSKELAYMEQPLEDILKNRQTSGS